MPGRHRKTYRVVARAEFHDVFRLLDDRYVGTFQHEPELEVISLEIPGESLLELARQAVRSARLSWQPKKTNRESYWGRPPGAGCPPGMGSFASLPRPALVDTGMIAESVISWPPLRRPRPLGRVN